MYNRFELQPYLKLLVGIGQETTDQLSWELPNGLFALAECLPICLLIQVEKGGKSVLEPRKSLIPLILY